MWQYSDMFWVLLSKLMALFASIANSRTKLLALALMVNSPVSWLYGTCLKGYGERIEESRQFSFSVVNS